VLSLSDIVNVKVGIGRGVFEAPGATVIGGQQSFSQFIKNLFSNNEQGFFYDPNDLSTMYQDAAGTVPVTAAGQAVGLMLDKSKGLVLGSNQISYPNSEELPAAVNMGDGVGTWALNTNAPISGTQDSRLIVTVPALLNSRPSLTFSCSSPLVPSKLYKFSFRYKVNSGVPRVAAVHTGAGTTYITPDKGVLQGSGTFDVFILWTAGSQTLPIVYFSNESVFDLQIDDISAREVKGNHAYQTTSASRPILQRNATTGAYYLAFDGVDDFLVTNNIDFTATDQLSLFAGVRKLSDVGAGIVAELSTQSAANAGTFRITAPNATGVGNYGAVIGGTVFASAAVTAAAPSSNIITLLSEITPASFKIRLNGAIAAQASSNQGTGNYGNYPLYIGRRAGTTLQFNGHLYGLIGIGRLTTDSETAVLEKSIAKSTGVTLNV
jgi:hypothetical protein